MISRRLLLLAGCLLLAFNLPVIAQVNSGLRGKVVDKDGQPLPTARVVLKNDSVGVNQTAITDANGEFRIVPLVPGKGYVLEVSFTGMSTIKMDVEITAGRIVSVPITLRPSAEMVEKMKVTAVGDMVDTEKTTTSTVFTSEFIDALPILGRDYQDVLTLAPGVSDVDGDGNPTIHGSRDTDVITLVDGVSTNDPLTGRRGQEINIESIDEIEVKTAGAGADYGRGQGGFVTLVTKSGGNEFEGAFSLYWRGNTFDGDGAGIDAPQLHGGLGELGLRDLSFNDLSPFLSLSGPIKKDKAWYFFTAEYIQIEEPVNALTQAFVRGTQENRVFGKISWDMSTNHKLQFTATWDPQTYNNLGIDSFTAVESGYTENRGGLNLLLKETAVFNPNVFLESTLQHFKLHPEAIPTLAADTNHNGLLFDDRNKNHFWDATEGDPGEDFDRDGNFDIFEDQNHNRVFDAGEDRDRDGRLTVSGAGCEGVNREDVDCDGHPDFFWEDANNNHVLDDGEDRDADRRLDYIDEDRNHNGVLDEGEDRNENHHLDTFDPADPFWENNPHPYIEDRNGDQIYNDRVRVLPDDVFQQYELGPNGERVLVGPLPSTYPYGEFSPLPRDRSYEQDQRTLRVSGPNAGQVLNQRGSTDYVSDLGRITLREDLTVFVPDWHGQHDLKFGGIVEHESYDQTTLLRPILFPNAQPPTANVIQPTIGVQLPAENQVFNSATGTAFGMYAMDTYKPLPNLTVGMGMRFDRESTDSFGYTPFDPVQERNLFDRINALGGAEHKPESELGNNDGILSNGYCDDPMFFDRLTVGGACEHPLVPNSPDENLNAIARMDQDLAKLRQIAPSRLTQHHTSTTLVASNLANLFPEAVKIDPVTNTQYIDREVLRENGAATFQEQEAFRLTNNNFAPRVFLSWDPWADSKTKIFANWGRYYDRLFLDTVVPEEGPDSIFRYYQRDANGVTASGMPNNGIGNPIAKAPPSATQVDRGLQTPFSDELTIGFERELAPEISLKITYINKKYRDQLQDRDINHSLRYLPTDPTVPFDVIGRLLTSGGAGGGTSSTRVNDGRPDLYIHNFFFNQIFHLANINSSSYNGVEFQVTKRLSRKWQMDASYTYSRNVGFADNFYSALGDDPATVGQTYGYQTDDQRHVIKFNAISYLPHDWQVGGTAQWSSGLPYSIISQFLALDNYDFPQFRFLYGSTPDRINPDTHQRDFIFTRRNDQRNDAILNINLHADKAFVIGKLSSRLFLDIQNVLNQDHLRIFTYEPSAPDRGGALQVNSQRDFGRRFQIGFQIEF